MDLNKSSTEITCSTLNINHSFPTGQNPLPIYQDESPHRNQEQGEYQSIPSGISVTAIPNPTRSHLRLFYTRRVETRDNLIFKTLREVVQIAQEILHEVELQEPRFISTLKALPSSTSPISNTNCFSSTSSVDTVEKEFGQTCENPSLLGYYDGLRVISSNRFEVSLYLNQMGVFNFVEDGSVPGGAALKLSDGRKRSMSLWVEFITASGYLSARKIRARFHSLVGQAIQKCTYRGILRLMGHTSEVRICVRERYMLQITPAFRCTGLWPRSASTWPTNHQAANSFGPSLTSNLGQWPSSQLINEVKREGFCLLSQESVYTKDKQTSVEGDAWLLDFHEAEERLLMGGSRRMCLSILKTLAEMHLIGLSENLLINSTSEVVIAGELEKTPIIREYDLKTLVLYECEKHPLEEEWTTRTLSDRINGVLLQLISCLQHRRCPHYFLPQLDLFRGYSHVGMDATARQAWCLLRSLLTCPRALEQL